jgi:hypothetical protein
MIRRCAAMALSSGSSPASAKGNHGGRPKVIYDDSLTFVLALKVKGVPVPDIAKKLTVKTEKNEGRSPSVASLYRTFAEAEQCASDDTAALRPKPARIVTADQTLRADAPARGR